MTTAKLKTPNDMTEATDSQPTTDQPHGLAASSCSPLDWRTDLDERDNTTWEANGPYTDEDGSCEYLFKITQRLREDRHEFVEGSDAELMMDDEDPRVWPSLAEAQQAMAQDFADIVRDCAAEANANMEAPNA